MGIKIVLSETKIVNLNDEDSIKAMQSDHDALNVTVMPEFS